MCGDVVMYHSGGLLCVAVVVVFVYQSFEKILATLWGFTNLVLRSD